MPGENLSEIELSQRKEGRSSEKDELGCASRRNNAEIELDVNLVLEEDDVCISFDLNF